MTSSAQNIQSQLRRNDDVVSTYFSLRYEERGEWYLNAPEDWKNQIDNETLRISSLRALLAKDPKYSGTISYLEAHRSTFTTRQISPGPQVGPLQIARRDIAISSENGKHSFAGPQASIVMFDNSVPLTVENPRCHGVFPCQTIPLYDLIEGLTDNPLMEKCPDGLVRWFHLPANNMEWIQKAMARYYREEDSEFSTHVQYSAARKRQAEMLLHREGWHGNLQGPVGGHYRYMKARCFDPTPEVPIIAPSNETMNDSGEVSTPSAARTPDALDSKKQNISLYMPYLHWEYGRKRATMMEVVRENERRSAYSGIEQQESPYDFVLEHRKIPLGGYLFRAARLANAMDEYSDELVLRKEIGSLSGLQLRRTLTQSDKWVTGLEWDGEQIVAHETSGSRASPKLITVDQLWMWVLDENTIITSFPSRYGAKQPDPSNVHGAICQRLAKVKKGEITSVFDLAIMILDQSSKVFFDNLRPIDDRPEVMEIFANMIGYLAHLKSNAFSIFWQVSEISKLKSVMTSGLGATRFDINPEGTLLRRAQSILDELRIIASHLKTQSKVIEQFFILFSELVDSQNRRSVNSHTPRHSNVKMQTKNLQHLLQQTGARQQEIEELIQGAESIQKGLVDLLDLKQKQALIADMPRQQYRARLQADQAEKQAEVLMIFTVVTIIFLPLSFCASIFGMNAVELNGGTITLKKEFIYMIPISLGMTLAILIIAFSKLVRNVLLFPGRLIWDYIVKRYYFLLVFRWVQYKSGKKMIKFQERYRTYPQ